MEKEKICGIYKIKNNIDDKVYIGQSINIKSRLAEHKSALRHNRHSNTYLQHAFNKYGEENFDFSIICECTRDELDELEKHYILNVYKSIDRNKGYNREGGGNLRKYVTKETRDKISIAGKNRFLNPEEVEKNRERAIKRYKDPNEHVKMSIAQKKRYNNPEECIKNSEARLKFYSTEAGKEWIEEYKNKMSKYWNDDEWKLNMTKTMSRTIVQLSLDMCAIKKWLSEKQIERELKDTSRQNVHKCLIDKYGTYGNGYKNCIWLYEDIYNNLTHEQIKQYIDKYKTFNYEMELSKIQILSRTKNRVVQLNTDMSFVKMWNSIREPEICGTDFHKSPIRRCCVHQTATYKGFIWMYEKEYLKINQESQNNDSLLLCSNE